MKTDVARIDKRLATLHGLAEEMITAGLKNSSKFKHKRYAKAKSYWDGYNTMGDCLGEK